ncbi:hypothetical protein VTG60DRAFT_2966 [Thermothelomyces hinnuleus]
MINFIYKAYKIGVNIYNWDLNKAYVVEAWHGDNAVIDSDQRFHPILLRPASDKITMPDGQHVTADSALYQQAGIVSDNKNKIFEGLGIALRVGFHEGSINFGFQVKYSLPRFEDNRLGIRGGLDRSLEAFYNDQSAYAPPGSYTARGSISGAKIPISCTTTALGGRDGQFYQFDVHIGLMPSGNRPHEPTGPPLKVSLKTPEAGVVPQLGEEGKMPDGTHYKVNDPSSISAE